MVVTERPSRLASQAVDCRELMVISVFRWKQTFANHLFAPKRAKVDDLRVLHPNSRQSDKSWTAALVYTGRKKRIFQ